MDNGPALLFGSNLLQMLLHRCCHFERPAASLSQQKGCISVLKPRERWSKTSIRCFSIKRFGSESGLVVHSNNLEVKFWTLSSEAALKCRVRKSNEPQQPSVQTPRYWSHNQLVLANNANSNDDNISLFGHTAGTLMTPVSFVALYTSIVLLLFCLSSDDYSYYYYFHHATAEHVSRKFYVFQFRQISEK